MIISEMVALLERLKVEGGDLEVKFQIRAGESGLNLAPIGTCAAKGIRRIMIDLDDHQLVLSITI